MKKMKKSIELTPELVLQKKTLTWTANGNGYVLIFAKSLTDANCIELALKTLNISYITNDNFHLHDGNIMLKGFEFKLDDIQKDCPNFYLNIKVLSDLN